MKEIKYKEFSNKEDLELEFFKELDLEIENIEEEIKNKLNSLFGYYSDLTLIKIIRIIDRRIIGEKPNYNGRDYFVFNEVLDLKVGDIIHFDAQKTDEYRYRKEEDTAKIFKMDKEVLNKEFLEKCYNKIKDSTEKLDIDTLNLEILKREDIEKKIEGILKKKKVEIKKGKKEEISKEEKERKLKEKYEKESVGVFSNGIKINKNIIEDRTDKFILKRNVNKIFDYGYFNEYYFRIKKIRDDLIDKKKSFTFKKDDKKIYNIQIEDNPKKNIIKSLTDGKDTNITKINGVRIRKNKVHFVLDRIAENTTKEKIKILNKLTGMKADLFKLKDIELNNIKIGINVSLIDENNFNVEIFGVKKELDWDTLKQDFFYGGGSRSIHTYFSVGDILTLGERFGLSKQDVYDYLKKVVLLNKLNENKNEK